MLVNINRGSKGIKEYLETGRKKDRDFSRDSADKRVVLSGDLELTDSIIKTVPTKSKYYHMVLSFKEDYVSNEDMKKAVDAFEKFAFSSYSKDEYNFYAEAHQPKLKSYVNKETGEIKIRKPHLHIVVPEINLIKGTQLKPLGFIKTQSLNYIDAFTEKYNMEHGFASPKNNRSNILKNHNMVLREEVLNHIIDNKIDSYEKFKIYLNDSFENVKTRNEHKPNSYFNIKPEYHTKGTNLNDFVFTKEFIENYPYEKKLEFLEQSAENEGFIEKSEPKIDNSKLKDYNNLLNHWNEVIAKEIKYINQNTKYYKEVYKDLSKQEKIEVLNQKEKEFYKKYNLKQEIENEIKDLNINTLEIKFTHANLNKSNEILQKINDYKEKKRLENIDFSKINIEKAYDILKLERGVRENKYKLDNKNIYLNNNSQVRISLKEFLGEELNMLAGEIQLLEDSIQRIEHDYNKKGKVMAIKINIKTNKKDNTKVDYYQMGKQDVAGRFTGAIADKASEHDTALAYAIDGKVVTLEQFKEKQPEMYKEIEDKTNTLFNINETERYNDKFRAFVKNRNISLSQDGFGHANSKYNFKELDPVEMGITKFEDAKKLDKNFFQIAKDFVTAKDFRDNIKVKMHDFKDKIKNLMISKPELAASNLVLAAQLQEMKIKLESIKTYQQALEKNQELSKELDPKIQQQNQEPQEQKEFSFKEILKEVKGLGDKLEDAKEISEIAQNPDFKDKRDTALELLNNLKDKPEICQLKDAQIENLKLGEAKAVNLMIDNNLQVESLKAVKEFIGVLKSVKDMSLEQSLDFENLLGKTLEKMEVKQQGKEQNQSKGMERE